MRSIIDKFKDNLAELGNFLQQYSKPVDHKNRYSHWEKIKYLEPPNGLSHEEWWYLIKTSRKFLYKRTPFKAKDGSFFKYCNLDSIMSDLHELDKETAGSFAISNDIDNTQLKKTYIIKNLVEEAINSSQLEGAATTRINAQEMILTGKKPKDKSERMILNNYEAMNFIRETKKEKLTVEMIKELHQILTKETLENSNKSGVLRTNEDEISVYDNLTNEVLHVPPNYLEIENRVQKLCDFANSELTQESFIHPIIKAIILHFILAYDHPFVDGNGRTARALFYWYAVKSGYYLFEYISISRIIKKAPGKYGMSFLKTETDDSDLTYFIVDQLEVIKESVTVLKKYINNKLIELKEAESLFSDFVLNFRQKNLLRHAFKNPGFTYTIESHQNSNGIAREASRKDLAKLAELDLLLNFKKSNKYYYVAPNNLIERIKSRN